MGKIWALGKIVDTGKDKRDLLRTLYVRTSGWNGPEMSQYADVFNGQSDALGGRNSVKKQDVFDELKSHNNDQLEALRKAQEDNTRQTNDYVKAQLDQINQLNAGFMKQIEDMRASHAAEMASYKQKNDSIISGLNSSFQDQMAGYRQKNDATISGLNQSFQNQIAGRDQAFQNELAMRDKRDMLRAQATNMALMKERAKNKRGEFSSATMLSNPASMSGLLLGRNSLLGL